MKQFKKSLLIATLLFQLIYLTNPAAAAIPASFKFVGSGFGHGVGLSQIGAKGQALEGKSATDILNYYFPGASVTPIPDVQPIRVNTAHQITTVSFSVVNEAPGTPFGMKLVDANSQTAQPINLVNPVSFLVTGNQIIVTTKGNVIGSSGFWSLNLTSPNSYLIQNIAGSTMKLKYGTIQLRAVSVTGKGYFIEVTDTMRLHDEYLYGISEVPSMWPAAALQSQIIASRTYALSRMDKVRTECDCNIYSSKYDQVYGGYTKELEPKYGALWRQAVDATAADAQNGLTITFNGAPINVYFFSSSGGQTQQAADVWGTSVPYLTSVPDPWSLDKKLNPKYSKWVRIISQKDMAKAFNLPDVTRYVINSRTKTGSILALTAYSSTGAQGVLPIGKFKSLVKLPSSWFSMPPTVTLSDSTTVTQ
jgi:stage II sporulation protein D